MIVAPAPKPSTTQPVPPTRGSDHPLTANAGTANAGTANAVSGNGDNADAVSGHAYEADVDKDDAGDELADGPVAAAASAASLTLPRAGESFPSNPSDASHAASGADEPDAIAEANAPPPAPGASASIDPAGVEALLFSTQHPLTGGRVADLLGLASISPVRSAVAELNRQYEATGRSFRVEQVAGGYQLLTLPDHAELLKKLHQKEADAKLTKAALETLAIIAYKQPVLRANVEAIRGVACGETIRSLMEKHLVRIAGRAEEPGRPILYGTTKTFFGGVRAQQPEGPSQRGGAAAARVTCATRAALVRFRCASFDAGGRGRPGVERDGGDGTGGGEGNPV